MGVVANGIDRYCMAMSCQFIGSPMLSSSTCSLPGMADGFHGYDFLQLLLLLCHAYAGLLLRYISPHLHMVLLPFYFPKQNLFQHSQYRDSVIHGHGYRHLTQQHCDRD